MIGRKCGGHCGDDQVGFWGMGCSSAWVLLHKNFLSPTIPFDPRVCVEWQLTRVSKGQEGFFG